jgi:phosphinothricin acetyltransferase
MLARHAEIAKLGLPYLVAESRGGIAGYAYANAYRPRPAYRFTVEDSIYLDPEQAGKGRSRILLGALLDIGAKGPWQQMIAVIGDSANVRSVRLHERFGFRHEGKLDAVGFKFDKWVDTILMQKRVLG